MSQSDTIRQLIVKTDYEPVSSAHKLNLLLRRSVRYSYRQKVGCCPTILCELLFPLIIIILLALSRYGVNRLAEQINTGNGAPGVINQRPCSQNLSTTPTSSKDIFRKCFKFPPTYEGSGWNSSDPSHVSNRTDFVFQPNRSDVNELVENAKKRLAAINCITTNVRSQNRNDDVDNTLLKNKTVNTVIVDFTDTSNLKINRNIAYSIVVRTPLIIPKNDPIDTSFIAFQHPSVISDRSNLTGTLSKSGSELPEFTDVKIFIDSLLMGYQSEREIQYELERNLMTCTPYHNDFMFVSAGNLVGTILLMIDALFIVPYLILLTSLIREKNAKVKEILKVLGIEPILNNVAQGIRTTIIYVILLVLLCIVYKLKLKPDAFFNTVNIGTLFFGSVMYSLQLISFCILNAQLFNSSVRAIVFTIIIYLITSNVFSIIPSWPLGLQYLLVFFVPFIAGRSLFQQAVLYDLAYKDVSFFRTIYRHVPMYFPTLVVIFFSCLFYWALSWYWEKVFPGEYGIPLEWNFLFKRDYWRASTSTSQVYSYDNQAATLSRSVEPVVRRNSSGDSVVHVDRLVKKFGPDKVAVNEVSFDLYENQITSLLGPNGSGKTTIFNCLIGIYKQTSGTITMVNQNGVGCDTRNNMELLRKSIGYCPQHDILFDLLTIEEQIQFYASARGYDKNKAQISHDMLQLVNLENAKDAYCKSLSGGMKRRLSLACAFVGDTKIVLLDEPSSGLDPSNRRLLWDWLRTMKEGKTLLLTTHFMEESDALSDRIIIITNGVIKVDGTGAKLKEQYGSGYKLVVNKQPNYSSNEIEGQLRQHLPQISIETDVADGDVVFRTNQQPDQQFVQALRLLETMKTNNLIKNYGIQNSTMDDVFLKITKDDAEENTTGTTTVDVDHIDEQCRHVFDNTQVLTGLEHYLSQLHGLTMKTLLVRYRRWGLTLLILLVPIIYNLLSNVISRGSTASGIFKMQPSSLNPQTILYTADPQMDSYFRSAVGAKSSDLKLEKRTENIMEMNRYIWQKRIDRPFTFSDIYLGFQVRTPQSNTYTIQTLSSNLIAGHEVISVASNVFFKYALNDTSASIQTTLLYKKTGELSFEPTIGFLLNLLSIASCFLKILPTSLLLDVFVFYMIFLYTTIFLVSERRDSFLSLLTISGLHPTFYWIFNYVFDMISSIIWFCYILAIYCLFDVAFNGSPSSRPSSSSALEFANSWDLRIQFYPLAIVIALPTFPFVYLITKIFTSDVLCGLCVFSLLVILHLVSIIVPIITSIANNKLVQDLLYWILNIISPSINAQAIVTYSLAQKSQFCRTLSGIFDFFKPIGDDTIWINWIILILQIILLLSLLIAIDAGLLRFSFRSSAVSSFDPNRLDSDVRDEAQRVSTVYPSLGGGKFLNANAGDDEQESDHLTVYDLTKRYPSRPSNAVDHLTFGARRGEAFGLLGFNGAGKTTTFRILVGDVTASRGTAFIDGQSVARRFRSIRRLGYCPQENCSMDFLTVEDGLYLLARVRGMPMSRIQSVVQTISSLFLLDPFLKNYIHQLSGGTKRRLHAALALIGPPLVAILDEPTTGVDPNARQRMQEIFLGAVKAKLTIILTSHSMDECERVCNRLGIMSKGQLACLGTIQHLKSKFGEGYTVEIKARSPSDGTLQSPIGEIKGFLLAQTQFAMVLRENTHLTASFQARQGSAADLFALLEHNKEALTIETYTISQPTLEQIFLSFAK